jgi:hypothetical protein
MKIGDKVKVFDYGRMYIDYEHFAERCNLKNWERGRNFDEDVYKKIFEIKKIEKHLTDEHTLCVIADENEQEYIINIKGLEKYKEEAETMKIQDLIDRYGENFTVDCENGEKTKEVLKKFDRYDVKWISGKKACKFPMNYNFISFDKKTGIAWTQHYTDIASEKLYTVNEFLQEEATAEDVRKITNSEFSLEDVKDYKALKEQFELIKQEKEELRNKIKELKQTIDILKNTEININPNYKSLYNVFQEAYKQASEGKGKERHANNEHYEQQKICTLNLQIGSNHGLIYQACKKSIESTRMTPDRAKAEILGAINYLAAAIIVLERLESEKN